MSWICRRTVKKVEERVARRWISGVGNDTKFDEHSLGWYVLLEEEPSAVFLGQYPEGEKPPVRVGDVIKITAEVEK